MEGRHLTIWINGSDSSFIIKRRVPRFADDTDVESVHGDYGQLPRKGDVIEIEIKFKSSSFEIFVNERFLAEHGEMHSPGQSGPYFRKFQNIYNDGIILLDEYLTIRKFLKPCGGALSNIVFVL